MQSYYLNAVKMLASVPLFITFFMCVCGGGGGGGGLGIRGGGLVTPTVFIQLN